MKAIIISNNAAFADKLGSKKMLKQQMDILGEFAVGMPALLAIKQYDPEIVLMDPASAYQLNAVSNKIAKVAKVESQYLTANTYQGIQILPISSVYYLQTEDKYVIAYHKDGELLITKSLVTLERELAESFIRIHRQTLVAKKYIKALEKTNNGVWYIILLNNMVKLAVSRRQLPAVRKYISQAAISFKVNK